MPKERDKVAGSGPSVNRIFETIAIIVCVKLLQEKNNDKKTDNGKKQIRQKCGLK